MNYIETSVENWLVSKGIYPFSVLYVKNPCFLKLSFFLDTEVTEFLNLIGYSKMCDISGIQIFNKTNTILLKDIGLFKFLEYVDN